MEQFRQRIMRDLWEVEEAVKREWPKKVISEDGNVKTTHWDGDLSVLLSTPLMQSFVGHLCEIQSSWSQLTGIEDWNEIYKDLIQFATTEGNINQSSHQRKMKCVGEEEVESLVVCAHALAVYSTSVLRKVHLQRLSSRIQSDVMSWTAKIFRFSAYKGFVADSSTSGLARICRSAINQKYPEFPQLGYETFQRMSPVIYVGRSLVPGIQQCLCSQLFLPVSSICLVETEMSYDFSEVMDLEVLQMHITRHKAENKVPLLVIAFAGSPCMGQVDHLTGLREICNKHGIWLHIEGNDLSTLSYLNVPVNIVSSQLADSLTLAIGRWLGLLCLPSITLYRAKKKQKESSEVYKVKEVEEETSEGCKDDDALEKCLPLWFALQHLGHDGITKRIEHAFFLAKKFSDGLQKISSIFILKRRLVNTAEHRSVLEMGLGEKIVSTIKSLIIQQVPNPSVVFYYCYKEEKPCVSNMNRCSEDHLLIDGANEWLAAEVFGRFRTHGRCPVSVIEIEKVGVCMRYCSLETDQASRCKKTDFEECMKCLDEKARALDVTNQHKRQLNVDLQCHPNLKLVSCTTWDGVGSVRYIPEQLSTCEATSSTDFETMVDKINCEIHKLICSADPTICLLGETKEGNRCIKLGIVRDCEHLKQLLQSISQAGNTVKIRS